MKHLEAQQLEIPLSPLVKGVEQSIQQSYGEMAVTSSSNERTPNENLFPNLYAITTKYNGFTDAYEFEKHERIRQALSSDSIPDVAKRKNFYGPEAIVRKMREWEHGFYRHIVNQVVPNNDRKAKERDYPVVHTFIDLSDSRHGPGTLAHTPHTHSIYIVPPATIPRFERLQKENFRINLKTQHTKYIQSVYCEPVWYLAGAIGYASKMLHKKFGPYADRDTRFELFDMHGPADRIPRGHGRISYQ